MCWYFFVIIKLLCPNLLDASSKKEIDDTILVEILITEFDANGENASRDYITEKFDEDVDKNIAYVCMDEKTDLNEVESESIGIIRGVIEKY